MTIQEIADYAMNEIAKYPTDMEFIRAVVEYALAEARFNTGREMQSIFETALKDINAP